MCRAVLLLIMVASLSSCVSRGMKIGEQIPEYNKNYNPSKKMIFAEGADPNKIVYQNLDENIYNRRNRHEDEFIDPEAVRRSLITFSKSRGREIRNRGRASVAVDTGNVKTFSCRKPSSVRSDEFILSAEEKFYENHQGKKRPNLSKLEIVEVKIHEGESLYSASKRNFGSGSYWRELISCMDPHQIILNPGDKEEL